MLKNKSWKILRFSRSNAFVHGPICDINYAVERISNDFCLGFNSYRTVVWVDSVISCFGLSRFFGIILSRSKESRRSDSLKYLQYAIISNNEKNMRILEIDLLFDLS